MNIENLMDFIMDSMKDQQGIFRGGKEGRVLGRVADAVEGFNKGPTYEGPAYGLMMNDETLSHLTSRPDEFIDMAASLNPKELGAVANDIKTFLGPKEGSRFLKKHLIIPQQKLNFMENYRSRKNESVDVRDIVLDRSRAKKIPGEVNQRKIDDLFGVDLRIEEAGY